MSIARLIAWVKTVVGYLVEKVKRGDHQEKAYAAVYGKAVQAAASEIIGDVREFLKR